MGIEAGTSIIITNTIVLYLSRHKERNLIRFSMRTTVNYIHMHILFLNMQVLDVGLKLNIAVFYNGTARC